MEASSISIRKISPGSKGKMRMKKEENPEAIQKEGNTSKEKEINGSKSKNMEIKVIKAKEDIDFDTVLLKTLIL